MPWRGRRKRKARGPKRSTAGNQTTIMALDLKTAVGAARALPPQQRAVLGHLAGGLARKEIAERMGLAHSTVDNHCNLLFKALGIQNSREAVRVWLASKTKP